MKPILTLILASLLISAPSFAANPADPAVPSGYSGQRLISLTSDKNANVYYVGIFSDSKGQAAGLFNDADPGNTQDPTINGDSAFWLKDIESTAGVVLAKVESRNALILQGKLDPTTQSGRFTLEYLSNGIFMSYSSCDFQLNFSGGQWSMQNVYTGAPIKEIRVLSTAFGITTIDGLCPAN